jgi:hypothetical protein
MRGWSVGLIVAKPEGFQYMDMEGWDNASSRQIENHIDSTTMSITVTKEDAQITAKIEFGSF